ncbi:UNVERIFIED_ORG: hypothetical protein EDC92_11417 [Dietzia maris]
MLIVLPDTRDRYRFVMVICRELSSKASSLPAIIWNRAK